MKIKTDKQARALAARLRASLLSRRAPLFLGVVFLLSAAVFAWPAMVLGLANPDVSCPANTNDTTPTWNWSNADLGLGQFQYKLGQGGTLSSRTTAKTFTPSNPLGEGNQTLFVQELRYINKQLVWSDFGACTVKIDTTSPAVGNCSFNPSGSTNGNVDASVIFTDSGSGPASQTKTCTITTEGGSCTVTASDYAANPASKTCTATNIDKTPPNAPSVSGASPTTNTTPTWSWTSGGGGGNGTFRYKLDNSDLTTGATATTGTSYTPASALSLADHTLYVQERDAANNWSASGSRTITITAPAPVPTATLSATPDIINRGGGSVLSWSSTNATSCTGRGSWSGNKALSGTQTVTPSLDATYILDCTGPGGADTRTVFVRIRPDVPALVRPANNTWTNSRQFCVTVSSPNNRNLFAQFVIDGATYTGATVASGSNSCYGYTTDTGVNGVSWYAYAREGGGSVPMINSDNSATWTAKIEQQNPTCTASFDNNTNITKASAICSDTGGSNCTGNPANQTVNAAGVYTFNVSDNAGNTGSCSTGQAYAHYSYGSWSPTACPANTIWDTFTHTRSCSQTRSETITYTTSSTGADTTRQSTTNTLTETDTAAPPAPGWAAGSSTPSPTKDTNPTVAWNSVTDNGGPIISGTKIYAVSAYRGVTLCSSQTTAGTSITLSAFSGCYSGNNTYDFFVDARDSAGNISAASSKRSVVIDTQNPTITSVSASSPVCNTVRFTVNGADGGLSGLASQPYSFDAGANWQTNNWTDITGASASIAANKIMVKDGAGNIYTHAAAVSGSSTPCDATGPTLNYTPNGSGGWKTTTTTITLTVSDPSGVSAAKYQWDGPASATVGTNFTNNATIASLAGSHTLYLWAQDTLGNPSTLGPSTAYQYDDAAPAFSITDNVNGSWNTSDTIIVTVSDNNGSGVGATTYRGYSADAVCNASDTYPAAGLSVAVNTDHTDYVCFRNTDAVSRIGYSSAIGPLKVDAAAPSTPTITCGSYTSNVWKDATAPTCSWTNPGQGPSPTTYYYCVSSACDPATTDADRSVATTFGNGANYFRTKNCDTGGCSSVAEFIVKRDQTSPTNGSVSNTNGYQTTTAITVTVNRGVDNESGMSANNADYTLKVASATLSAGSCGGFGAYADAGVAETASAASYTYTGVNAKCYKFSYDVKNSVAIPATWTGTDITKIDTTDPTPPGTPSSVSNYSYTGNFTISWSASTDTGSGISYYYLAQSSDFGSNYVAANPSNVNSPATSWSPASALPEGAYRYTIRAFDAAGRQSSLSNASADIRVDKTAPTVDSFDVQPRTANPTDSFGITYSVSDTGGSGFKQVEVWRNPNASGQAQWGKVSPNLTAFPSGSWTDTTATPGSYQYGLHTIDQADNCITEDTGATGTGGHTCGGVGSDLVIRTDRGPIQVTKLSDNTPPFISGGAVAPFTTVGAVTYTNDSTPTLSVTTDENATCKFDFTDKAYASMANTFTGALTKSHSKTLTTAQSDGPKTVYVRCQDTASPVNTNTTSYSFAYTVDMVAPGASGGEMITITLSARSDSSTEVKTATTGGYTYNTFPTRVPSSPDNKPSYTIACTGCNNSGDPVMSGTVIFQGKPLSVRCSLFPSDLGTCTSSVTALTLNLNSIDIDRNGTWKVPKNFFKDPAGNQAGTASEYFSFTVNNRPPNILP